MTVFWTLVAAMTVIALVFVIPPLFVGRHSRLTNRDELNTEIIRDQLKELRADLDTGKLDAEAYEAARRDLERDLLDTMDRADHAPPTSRRGGLWVAGLLVVVVPLLAVGLYQQIGTQEILPHLANASQPQPEPAPSQASRHTSLESIVTALAERLREEPDNVQGWVLLGRSYAALNRHRDAAAAYGRAYRLAGGNAGLIADYVDVLVTANGGRFSEKTRNLLDEALSLQPANLKALWLKGTMLYRQGDYRGAIEHWQRVAERVPKDSENATVIASQIRQARSQLSAGGEDATAPGAGNASRQPAAPAAEIQVQVSLDPDLADRVEAGDTLFVYARAMEGPPMPLAIVRKQAGALPVTVTLDDSQAMSPAMKLSSFDEVEIQARVSKTGQAMTASGDLRGAQSPVSTSGSEKVHVTINEVVP